MVEDTVSFIRNCVVCAATDDVAPRRQAPMEARHPTRRFQTVAIDVQTITPRAKSGNKKVLAMIDVFTRFARAVGIKDEKADIIADALLKEWISLFGPMEVLQSDGGTNIMGKIVEHLTNELGVGRTQTYPLHPQANGTVERWNRTLARDLACFVATGEDDWDEHVALACFRYNSSVCSATGMTPYQAMFGIEAFEAWGEVDIDFAEEEPESLACRLSELHKQLLSRARKERTRAKLQYDKAVKEVRFKVGDRVLVWSENLNKAIGRKIIKPWLGPYKIVKRLGRVGYELKSEVGDKVTRAHANRLRKIRDEIVETGEPRDGVFPDSLRMLGRISAVKTVLDSSGGARRLFKVSMRGKGNSSWTPETDLPEVVVKLYDRRRSERTDRSERAVEEGSNDDGSLLNDHDYANDMASSLGAHRTEQDKEGAMKTLDSDSEDDYISIPPPGLL